METIYIPWCQERSMRTSLRGGSERSSKVSPETEPLKRFNENFVAAVSLAEEQWCECGHIGDIGCCKGVKGEAGSGKLTFRTSICGCYVEMSEYVGKGCTAEYIKSPSLECGADDEEASAWLIASCTCCFVRLWAAVGNVRLPRPLRWLLKKRRNGNRSAKRKAKLDSLPVDIRENIFRRLSLKELFRSKVLSKSCEELAEGDALFRLRGAAGEGSFTAINFFMKENAWQCTGFDLQSKTWTRLPTFSCLPTPDLNLFKEYSVCGSGGLMCANVSKVPHKEELVVFNLLTRETRQLPSLHYPRNPVLLHILVDSATNAYKVIAAGSSSSSSEDNLSRRIEVFDSRTLQWEVASDLPGPEFGLNEHQTGVCVDEILYFIAFLEADGHKSVVGFDVEKGEWLQDRNCYVPCNSNILQLVESGGNVYLFSEQEHGGAVEHCIDVLHFSINGSNGEAACELKSVVRVKKSGGQGLLVYPEYTCVPYGKGKLCVFNTIRRDGLVYDIQTGMQCEVLEEPPVNQRGDNFFSLNPVSFSLQPNFVSNP